MTSVPTPAERKWTSLVNAAQPSPEGPVGDAYSSTPALRALVRQHVGARTCPSSVNREDLLSVAVRLRLVTSETAAKPDRARATRDRPDVAAGSSGKRTRTDRADKNKRRKTVKLITVKCALLNRLRCGSDADSEVAARIIKQLKLRVEAYSRRVVNASVALVGIVKGLFRRDIDGDVQMDEDLSWIADVHVPPEIFTQTFVRQLFLGTAEANLPSQMVVQCHQAHPQLLLPGNRHLGDRNIYSAGAIQYLTNLKNALRTELDDRIRIACRRIGLQPEEEKVVRYRINGWTLPARFGCCLPQTAAADAAVAIHRRMLGLAGLAQIDDDWIKNDAHLPSLLRYSVYLNKIYEASENKLYNLVPVCSIRAHFIRIDTSVLYGVLRDAGVVDRTLDAKTFVTLRDVFWFDTFDFRKIRPGGSTFEWSVTTDGVSLCTTFEKEAAPRSDDDATRPEYVASPTDVVVGNDPGRINIYYMAGIRDGRTRVSKLTRKQYYAESGCTAARRVTERWTRCIQPHLDALSSASSKGTSWTGHEWYLIQLGLHQEALWVEYMKPRWARQRLSLYGGKKRVFANFFNRLASTFPGGRLVIAYGNAKFPSGGAGEQSVPTTRAYKECVSRVCTYSTDEFRTSKVHCADDSVLQLVSTRSRPRFALRGLLFNPELDRFVSRDLNAALNIRRILIGPTRPVILCRNGVFPRLDQHIVKRLQDR